jgi:hypothetical protein
MLAYAARSSRDQVVSVGTSLWSEAEASDEAAYALARRRKARARAHFSRDLEAYVASRCSGPR